MFDVADPFYALSPKLIPEDLRPVPAARDSAYRCFMGWIPCIQDLLSEHTAKIFNMPLTFFLKKFLLNLKHGFYIFSGL